MSVLCFDQPLSFSYDSRPKTIDDISSQEQAVAVLKKALQSNNVSP